MNGRGVRKINLPTLRKVHSRPPEPSSLSSSKTPRFTNYNPPKCHPSKAIFPTACVPQSNLTSIYPGCHPTLKPKPSPATSA